MADAQMPRGMDEDRWSKMTPGQKTVAIMKQKKEDRAREERVRQQLRQETPERRREIAEHARLVAEDRRISARDTGPTREELNARQARHDASRKPMIDKLLAEGSDVLPEFEKRLIENYEKTKGKKLSLADRAILLDTIDSAVQNTSPTARQQSFLKSTKYSEEAQKLLTPLTGEDYDSMLTRMTKRRDIDPIDRVQEALGEKPRSPKELRSQIGAEDRNRVDRMSSSRVDRRAGDADGGTEAFRRLDPRRTNVDGRVQYDNPPQSLNWTPKPPPVHPDLVSLNERLPSMESFPPHRIGEDIIKASHDDSIRLGDKTGNNLEIAFNREMQSAKANGDAWKPERDAGWERMVAEPGPDAYVQKKFGVPYSELSSSQRGQLTSDGQWNRLIQQVKNQGRERSDARTYGMAQGRRGQDPRVSMSDILDEDIVNNPTLSPYDRAGQPTDRWPTGKPHMEDADTDFFTRNRIPGRGEFEGRPSATHKQAAENRIGQRFHAAALAALDEGDIDTAYMYLRQYERYSGETSQPGVFDRSPDAGVQRGMDSEFMSTVNPGDQARRRQYMSGGSKFQPESGSWGSDATLKGGLPEYDEVTTPSRDAFARLMGSLDDQSGIRAESIDKVGFDPGGAPAPRFNRPNSPNRAEYLTDDGRAWAEHNTVGAAWDTFDQMTNDTARQDYEMNEGQARPPAPELDPRIAALQGTSDEQWDIDSEKARPPAQSFEGGHSSSPFRAQPKLPPDSRMPAIPDDMPTPPPMSAGPDPTNTANPWSNSQLRANTQPSAGPTNVEMKWPEPPQDAGFTRAGYKPNVSAGQGILDSLTGAANTIMPKLGKGLDALGVVGNVLDLGGHKEFMDYIRNENMAGGIQLPDQRRVPTDELGLEINSGFQMAVPFLGDMVFDRNKFMQDPNYRQRYYQQPGGQPALTDWT